MITSPESILSLIKTKGIINLPKNLKITPNFGWYELLKNQNEIPTPLILQNIKKVATILDIYRDKVFNKAPIAVNCGWRSLNYNKNMKPPGATKSYHISGLAVDFCVAGLTSQQAYNKLDPIHFGGLELANGWTHLDLRGSIIRFNSSNIVLASHFKLVEHNKVFKK